MQGLTSPCIFYNKAKDIRVVVHGDDFTVLAEESQIRWLTNLLGAKMKVKLRGILGPDPSDTKQITILNRIVTWNKYNLTFEADTRHGEILVNTILEASCNSVLRQVQTTA